MKIRELISVLESWAPLKYAESYDNAGLITGAIDHNIRGILICLDSTEEIIDEAIRLEYNVVLAHHPIVFKGLKKINGSDYVQRAIIKAIKNDIAIYAIHTNLDNVITGVNHEIANILELQNQQVLLPKQDFEPMVIGSGILGQLSQAISEQSFLSYLLDKMQLPLIKHSVLLNKPVYTVAVCGGAGSFLIPAAIQCGADVLVTADLKYHEYFDANNAITLMDIGHFESERFTIDLIRKFVYERFPSLRISQTSLNTNPVQYFH